MTISVGDKLPEVTLIKATEEGPQPVKSSDYFAGKRIALFSVPGAFTPTCSAKHLPGFVEKAADLKAKGVDEIVGTAVNDAFVMYQWGKHLDIKQVKLLPDGSGMFTRRMGMLVERTSNGMGLRSWRYSMLVNDGVIEKVFAEPDIKDNPNGVGVTVSDADTMLAWLKTKA